METKAISTNQGGTFILNATNPQDIFCPEDFSEEQQMMKESVIDFVDREIWPQKARFEKIEFLKTFKSELIGFKILILSRFSLNLLFIFSSVNDHVIVSRYPFEAIDL